MRCLAWSPNLTAERCAAAGVEFAISKEKLFKEADILSVHMVLASSTTKMVGAADLALLKTRAILINTSRGALIDEEALIDVLRAHKIRGRTT